MDYIQLTVIVTPKQPGTDILIAELAEIGFESFEETANGCRAWIQLSQYDEHDLSEIYILKDPEYNIEFDIEKIASHNWNEEWEKNFSPIEINNRAVIKADFHKLDKTYEYEFLISPKMAFGTGHHETTWMMADALFNMDLIRKTVLDMGCGTGILAVIAEKLGAQRVVAIDIEEAAVDNTLEHMELNSCNRIDVRLGGADLLGDEHFDVILANINRNVLLNDMEKYVSVLKKGGSILFSGFFSTDIELIQGAATKSGLSFVTVATKNNWAQLTFGKAL